jgi:hypothetical protein
VSDSPGKLADGLHPLREAKLLLDFLPFGDVYDGSRDQRSIFRCQRPQTDLHGKLGSILPARE